MRIVIHGRDHPYVVKLGELPGFAALTTDDKILNYEVHLCACGLSKHKPYCDGSHVHVNKEEKGKVFAYTKELEGKEVNDQNAAAEIKELPEEYP